MSATNVYVRFLPTAVQGYSTNIAHMSSGAATVTKAVSGSGVAAGAPVVVAVPGSLVFGNVITNKTSAEQTFQVSGSNLTDNVTVTAPAGFWIHTNGGSVVQSFILATNAPGTLDPVTVWVSFAPTAPGSYSPSISNTSLGAVDALVSVSGAGVVQGIAVSGGPLAFGNVIQYRTNTLSYVVSGSNLEANVTVTAPSADFKVSTSSNSGFASSLQLTPAGGAPTGGVVAATTVYVQFIPTISQAHSAGVTNSSPGATARVVSLTAQGVDIPGPIAYVVTNGTPGVTPTEPYNTWGKAAFSIQTAIDYAGANPEITTVMVTNGTYTIGTQIAVPSPITVRSFGNGVYGGLGNASNTILNGTARKFYITDAGAVIEGFTIQDGRTGQSGDGDGVYMTGGLVRDCIVRNNGFNNHKRGPGVYMTGGTVSNCIVRGNQANVGTCSGAIWANNGLITHCQILNNTNQGPWAGDGGGGVYMNGASAVLRNCLLAGNSVGGSAGIGGGVYLNAGTIESCTIVTNSASIDGGGVYRAAGTVSNSIVYFNYVGSTHSNLNTTAGLGYSCSINPGTTANGNITGDPLFAGADTNNFALTKDSPCIDKGSNQAWMDGALDLAGNSRKQYGGKGGLRSDPSVDMGAYEAPTVPPQGTMFMLR
ncbi:MAG: hypothetical protein FJ279_29830 [Planctomycetes bacterium]|nr:hypothetical protein [Planctomycetota bacterium]